MRAALAASVDAVLSAIRQAEVDSETCRGAVDAEGGLGAADAAAADEARTAAAGNRPPAAEPAGGLTAAAAVAEAATAAAAAAPGFGAIATDEPAVNGEAAAATRPSSSAAAHQKELQHKRGGLHHISSRLAATVRRIAKILHGQVKIPETYTWARTCARLAAIICSFSHTRGRLLYLLRQLNGMFPQNCNGAAAGCPHRGEAAGHMHQLQETRRA